MCASLWNNYTNKINPILHSHSQKKYPMQQLPFRWLYKSQKKNFCISQPDIAIHLLQIRRNMQNPDLQIWKVILKNVKAYFHILLFFQPILDPLSLKCYNSSLLNRRREILIFICQQCKTMSSHINNLYDCGIIKISLTS